MALADAVHGRGRAHPGNDSMGSHLMPFRGRRI